MSQNTFVQIAVEKLVDEEAAKTGINWEPFTKHPEVPGYYECLLYQTPGMKLREDERQRWSFVDQFREFFYLGNIPNVRTLQHLWPNINKYMELWGTGKPERPIREAMARDLEAMDIPVPDEWKKPRPANAGYSNEDNN